MRLLSLTPKAEAFYQGLAERRLNVLHHVRKIVALSEIYGTEKTARAIEDALEFQAFSCEYIANLLEQRQRLLPEAGRLAPDPPAGPAGPGTARTQPGPVCRPTADPDPAAARRIPRHGEHP